MGAPCPAARPSHATFHLIYPYSYAALAGLRLLGRGNPADPLVTREWGYIRPHKRCLMRGSYCFTQVTRKCVHDLQYTAYCVCTLFK